MKRCLRLLPVLALCLLPACQRPRPTLIEDPKLGIRILFPGEPLKNRYAEPTPFSSKEAIEWYCYQYSPPARMDEDFHVDVGNLPMGSRPGDSVYSRDPGAAPVPIATVTPRSVLDVFQAHLEQRMGPVRRIDLPLVTGAGFRYAGQSRSGHVTEGIVILQGWRLHHAQATVKRADDPRLRAFLDSFRMLPA